ncbi:GNAT family N-acetyltransferase [Kutzneria viridogrisea]|uniref:GNAT superfamily N-acetyltransferase n=1 Tax=Kutzneria viridogrisea TaxID=47990 RepID=A0ABR6BL98_9PSEU|nr:GNAT superfamily N-acetyltransferase [Kutzneria viridogrisea]
MTEPFVTGPHRVDQPHPELVDAMTGLWHRVTLAGGAGGFAPADPVEEIRTVATRVVKDVRARRSHLLTLGADHALAGFAVLTPGTRPVRRHTAELEWLMVEPELQGRGWGGQLLTAVELHARALGIEQLVLITRTGHGVERFYEKQGWTERGRWPGAVRMAPGDVRDQIWFTREVG